MLRHGVYLFVLLAASHSYAANEEIRERTARKACLSGDFQKGIDILSDLFLDSKEPTYIFNQGRCFEQNNRYEEAIARFREYLRMSPNLNRTLRDDTEKHIAECQSMLVVLPVEPSPVALPPKTPSVPPTPEVADFKKGLRIAGIAFGVASLVPSGIGVYYYTRARSYSNKVNNADVPNLADDEAGRNAVTMQWVFFGVGAASLATGAVLYWLGWPEPTTQGTVMLGPGVRGVMVKSIF